MSIPQKKQPIQKRLGHFDQLVKEWKVIYLTLKSDLDNGYWIEQDSNFESICVGWCMAKGLTLTTALDFYQEMVTLRLF